MFTPGIGQLLIVLVIILLFFGGKRIPQMMRSIGQSVTEFKKGVSDTADEDDKPTTDDA